MDLLELLKVLLSFIGPLLVVFVSARLNKALKDDEQAAKNETEQRKREREELVRMITQLDNKVDNLAEKVNNLEGDLGTLTGTVETMQKLDECVRSDLAVLGEYHKCNTGHIQKIGEAVIALAEGLRDNHMDGNITSAVANLKAYEAEMYTRLLSQPRLSSITSRED